MIIKICGITHPEDAALAASLGANWIGILLSKRSRRYVDPSLAHEIAMATKEKGSIPVGIFMDEGLDEILLNLEKTGIIKAQLHGSRSLSCLRFLPSFVEPVICVGVNPNGICQPLTCKLNPSHFVLYDHVTPGSGKSFPWNGFQPSTPNPWILAGGLNPQNVRQAIAVLKPNGVDVSTGVSIPGSLRKDPVLLEQFINLARKKP
jgi:phosphoribosylanthranilate isomerase